ncbi:MATE family efflux transporter [Sphaerisporangium siamense]|uniref:Probable multidrug resistance protein NorM n=1 Tax=Sphaerisporangium siamense TaxID=795645 RepID=A0A7W7D5N9_9ACTN|nr:MATE family efflux transporter [Sphaerisporangium siamense]MBB4699366.1 putative MATE family efflux protein [Sphaerisporangium siamense]GII89276.1 MATE family efflux transporter [Sphaerisporangium siamense]
MSHGTPPASAETGARPAMGQVWDLALPLLVAGLTQIVVNLVDTVLLARLSPVALGAFALAAPVHLIGLVIVRGWATAVQVRVSRAHGAGRPGEVAQIVRAGLATSVMAGVAVGAVLFVTAGPVLALLGASGELIGPGVAYLRVLALAVPFAAASFTLLAACSGIGVTRASLYNAVLVNVVNVPLGVLLIFNAGLGLTGAALATFAATAAGTGFLLIYSRARLPRAAAGETPEGGQARGVIAGLWAIGWPEMGAMGVGYVNEALLAGFAARIGTLDLAAYRIVDNLLLLVFTMLSSAATAITILAGQALGRGDHAHAEAWRRTGAQLLLIMLAVPSAVILVLGRPLLSLITGDAVAALAWAAVPLALLSMAPMVLAMSHAALLRAAGDSRGVMIVSVACDYAVLIPLGWVLGVLFGLGLPGLYAAWIAFAVLFAALLHIRSRHQARRDRPPAASVEGRGLAGEAAAS